MAFGVYTYDNCKGGTNKKQNIFVKKDKNLYKYCGIFNSKSLFDTSVSWTEVYDINPFFDLPEKER